MKRFFMALMCLLCVVAMLASCAAPTSGTANSQGEGKTQDVVSQLSSTVLSGGASGTIPAKDDPLPENAEIWDGTVATSFAGGIGTPSDPLQIATPAQWAYFIKLCNETKTIDDPMPNNPVNGRFYYELSYVITADLYFNPDFEVTITENENGVCTTSIDAETKKTLKYTPVSKVGIEFKGTMDGGNHKFYNVYGSRDYERSMGGLFYGIDGSVKNLHLVRGYMDFASGDDWVGTFANSAWKPFGAFAADLTGTIANCSASCVVFSRQVCAGIIGSLGASGNLSSVYFLGDAYAGTASAGIAARANGTTISISDCYNLGNIYVNNNGDQYAKNYRSAGGIVAFIGTSNISFKNCINYGNVTSLGDYTGGILGTALDMYKDQNLIQYCANYGTIQGANYVGGMMGYAKTNKYCLDISDCMEFAYCYQYGTVTATSKYAGGMIGFAKMPVYILNCGAGGEVYANYGAGGAVGAVDGTFDQWKVGASSIEVLGTLLDGVVSTIDVNGTQGTAAGGVVGCLIIGNPNYTGVSLNGSVIFSTLRGRGVGGVIGECSYSGAAKKTSSKIVLNYALVNPRIERADENSKYGTLCGSLQTIPDSVATVGTPVNPDNIKYSYITTSAYIGMGSNAVLDTSGNIRVDGDKPNLKLKADFALVEEKITDGSYLNILNMFAASNQGVTKWSMCEDLLLPTGIAQIYEALPDMYYTGKAVEVTHSKWTGIEPFVRFAKLQDDGTWEYMTTNPKEVGIYRAEVVLFSTRAYGGTARIFEIEKQRIDASQLKWQDNTTLYYTGGPQTPTLEGLIEGLEVRYVGQYAMTNVGSYTVGVEDIYDPSGRYEIYGVEQIPTLAWKIETRILKPSNIVWSATELTYNEGTQTIYLVDQSDPTLDLTSLLNISYVNNSAVNAGTYLAEATIPPLQSTANISWDGIMNTSPRTTWKIVPRVIYPEDCVSFGLLETIYNGEKQTLSYDIKAPKGVKIEPVFDPSDAYFVNAGQYNFVFNVIITDDQNNVLSDGAYRTTLVRTFEIQPAQPTISAKGMDTTYSGLPIVITDTLLGGREATFSTSVTAIAEELAECGSIRYEYYLGEELVEEVVNAGKYTVKVIFEPQGNTNFARTEVSVSLYVRRATYHLEGNIALRDGAVLANGKPQNLTLKHEEDLPDFITPVYSEGYINPGVYTVVCQFVFSEEMAGNYEPLPAMTATLTILTYELVDEITGLQIAFPLGDPTSKRLLVEERKDVSSFNTAWQVGWNTSLKLLYQVEIKQGVNPSDFEGAEVEIRIPVGRWKFENGLVPVSIFIDDNGEYTIVQHEDYEFEEIDDVNYIVFKTKELAYYGLVTKDSNAGQITWYITAGIVAVPCAVVLIFALISRGVKKAKAKKEAKKKS